MTQTKEEEKFDLEAYKKEAIRKLLNKEPGVSIDKLMKPLMKQILEAALEGEMDVHMEREGDIGNRKNTLRSINIAPSKTPSAFSLHSQIVKSSNCLIA